MGTWSLASTDQDEITQSVIDKTANEIEEALKRAYNNRVKPMEFWDDTGSEPYAHTDFEGWVDYCRSSTNFKGVAAVYDDLYVKRIFEATTSKAAEIKNLATPNIIATTQNIINKMVQAYREGETALELAPESGLTDAELDGLTSDPAEEDEQVAAYEARAKQAEKDAQKAEEARSKGQERANTIAFQEQCFMLSYMPRIIKHKYKGISKFKKLPYHEDTLQTNDRPSNASLMVHDDPFHFINKLLLYSDTHEYFNMRTEDIANLQPEIRFFKSTYDKQAKQTTNTEIKFNTTFTNASELGNAPSSAETDLMSLLGDNRRRNAGVGIKSFNLSFIGTDPFAAKKDLRGTLELYCASMEELFKKRQNNPRGKAYRYIDLALKTITTNTDGDSIINKAAAENADMTKANTSSDDLNRLDFAIKAKIGIRAPQKTVAGNADLLAAIARNTVTVQMTPVTHEFNFNDDGSLVFRIQYVPFISDAFNSSIFDVFGAALDNLEDRLVNQTISANCNTELMKTQKEKLIKERRKRNSKRLSYLVQRLYDKQQVHYLRLPPAVVKDFNNKGPATDIESVFTMPKEEENSGQNADAAAKEVAKEATEKGGKEGEKKKTILKDSTGAAVSIGNANLPYFYLADLIDIAMENVEYAIQPSVSGFNESYIATLVEKLSEDIESPGAKSSFRESANEQLQNFKDAYASAHDNWKKFRIILGPMEIVDPANSDNVMIINLGDIPITVKYFQEWLASEILKKDRQVLPISVFITKLLQKMVSNFVNTDRCFGGEVKHRVMINRTEAMCYNEDPKYDDITAIVMRARNKGLDAAGLRGKSKSKNQEAAKDLENIPVVDRLPIDLIKKQPVLYPAGLGSGALNDNTSSDSHYHYLIFYASRTTAIDRYKGDEIEDYKRGCHHYRLGRDVGIVKTIKLNRDKRPFLKESRFEASGHNGLKQLIEVYNVNIQSYANFNVFPGAKIFVDPRGWAPAMDPEFLKEIGGDFNNMTELGIGGYYDITKVEHTFGPGTFESSYTAYWTNGIGQQYNKPKENPTKKTESKCKKKNEESTGSSQSEKTNAARSAAAANPPFMQSMLESLGEAGDALMGNDGVSSTIEKIFSEGYSPTTES